METATQFRQFAEECNRLAQEVQTETTPYFDGIGRGMEEGR